MNTLKILFNQEWRATRRGFSMIELLIALVITSLIVIFSYKIFFSQAEVVTKSIEFMQVNDAFRKVMTFMGDDIRESTSILEPAPVFKEKVEALTTKTGVILKLRSSELNPRIKFNSPLGGQVSLRREIIYELEKIPNPNSKTIPRFRLIRTSTIEEKPGHKTVQKQQLIDNVRDLVVYRTVRKPFKPSNISSEKDRIVVPRPLYESGTGDSLVHIKMVLERDRKSAELGEVYNINLNTSFYKRGKEIFINP